MSLAIYLAGVAIGLMVMRDPWRERLAPALLWPLGPAAFAVVVVILLAAAVLLWPIPALSAALLAALAVWAIW